MKKLYILCAMVIFCQGVQGQELGLHFMKGIAQSMQTNPAILTNDKFHISLPSAHVQFYNSGFSYDDVVSTNAESKNVLNLDNVLNSLDADDALSLSGNIQAFGLSFAVKDWQFSIYQQMHFDAGLNYGKDFLSFFWNGNQQFVGQTVNIAPNAEALAYNEVAFGIARQVDKWTFGVRLKKLNGLAYLSTNDAVANITTSPSTYDLDIQTDINVVGAAAIDFGGFENFDLDSDNFEISEMLKNNSGFGVDLGATFQFTDKITFAASILNIGSINWDSNAYSYRSVGTANFSGADISDLFTSDTDGFEESLKAIDDGISYTESTTSFTSSLPLQFYLSGTYQAHKNISVGALIYGEESVITGSIEPGVILNATGNLGQILAVGVTAGYRNESFGNIGLAATLDLGPMQLYAVTNNASSSFSPLNSKGIDARFGLNFAFGKRSKQSKKASDEPQESNQRKEENQRTPE